MHAEIGRYSLIFLRIPGGDNWLNRGLLFKLISVLLISLVSIAFMTRGAEGRNPFGIEAEFQRSLAALEAGETAAALRGFRTILAINPDLHRVRLNRGLERRSARVFCCAIGRRASSGQGQYFAFPACYRRPSRLDVGTRCRSARGSHQWPIRTFRYSYLEHRRGTCRI